MAVEETVGRLSLFVCQSDCIIEFFLITNNQFIVIIKNNMINSLKIFIENFRGFFIEFSYLSNLFFSSPFELSLKISFNVRKMSELGVIVYKNF